MGISIHTRASSNCLLLSPSVGPVHYSQHACSIFIPARGTTRVSDSRWPGRDIKHVHSRQARHSKAGVSIEQSRKTGADLNQRKPLGALVYVQLDLIREM